MIYFPGQLRQYQVQVDWGDGAVDVDSAINFIKSGNDFSGTWTSDPCHSYSACGTYTIIAKIYHQNSSGAEAGETEATIRVCVSYDLTVNSTTGGSVIEPGEGTFAYDGGSPVNIVAQPDPCYQFVNWTGDVDTVDNANAAATTVTMNGDYSVTANFELNLPVADAGSDQEICAGSSVPLGGSPTATNGTSPYTYSWSPAEGLSDPSVANPIASPSSNTTYTVTVTDSKECTASDSVEVTVNEPPTITCSGNITVNNDPGQCGAVVSWPAPIVTGTQPVGSSCSPPSGMAAAFSGVPAALVRASSPIPPSAVTRDPTAAAFGMTAAVRSRYPTPSWRTRLRARIAPDPSVPTVTI